MNWNQLGQVPVPSGVRSPKGQFASSITKVDGATYVLVEVVEVVTVDVLLVVVDVVEEVVVEELEGPEVAT